MELVIMLVGVLFFILFIYLTFKQIEFVVVAIDLYRKMLDNQKDIVMLLKDVRDGTKLYVVPIPEIVACPHCGATLRLSKKERKDRTFDCAKCKQPITM